MTSWTLVFMDPDLSRMTLTRTRCLRPNWADWELFALISSSPCGQRSATGLPREAQFVEQSLAGFLATVKDVAEILLGQVQLGRELAHRWHDRRPTAEFTI